MIRAIALDDEPLSLELIESFCELHNDIDLVKKFVQPKEAMKYLRKFPVDVIFLDINMPNYSGIQLAELIGHGTRIIFITAHAQYAVQSYNLDAVDYLLKPFEYERFEKAVARLKTALGNESGDNYICVRYDYKLAKVNTEEILLIESLGDYLRFSLKNGTTITTRMTMNDILLKLPEKQFVRVHRSFTLPVWRINTIRDKKIILGASEIPVGVRYEKEVQRLFKG